MEKLLITNEYVATIIEEMFKSNTKSVAIQKDNMVKQVDLYTDLSPYFFCFQKDTTPQGFYGLSEETQIDYVEQITNQMQQVMCLVETSNIDLLASSDIDGGNFNATLTFFIPTDKIPNLDYYVNYLRNVYQGKYETIIDNDKETLLIAKIGSLNVNDEPFNSPIGRANICTLDISFGFLDYTTNYTEESEKIQVSEDGTNYSIMPITSATMTVSYNTQGNTIISDPKGIGEISTSASFTMSISYYELTKFPMFKSISNKALGVCSLNQKSNYDLNNYIYVKFRDFEYKMIVKTYTASVVNTDFTNVSISLSLAV